MGQILQKLRSIHHSWFHHRGIKGIRMMLLSGILGLSCTTRVSEWILLNSLPVNYSLVYVHNGPVPDFLKKQHEALKRELVPANIRFSEVQKAGTVQPFYTLYYKNRLFATYSNPGELNNLVASTLRKMVAAELMEGKLCVMLYLKTGDKGKDDRGIQVLNKALEASPFRGIIPVVELDRNSTEEAHFVNMLLNVEEDLKTIREPMLFGIFGRFKALEPLLAGGITEENIGLMIGYLKAECSCLIKDNLPGTDILFAGNWENPKPALLNKILDEHPELDR